jgi:hypothetical protein
MLRAGPILVCASVLACARSDATRERSVLEARWSGGDSGSFRGVATARWCTEAGFGELLGVRGDTGVAIALRHADSFAPGRYPAVPPDSADTSRPSATVGLRFLSRTSVTGYQSDSGWVTFDRDAAHRLGASFQVRARVVGGVASVRLEGRATAVPVERGGEACTTSWRPSE